MTDFFKQLTEINDELTRLNKKLNWQLYNLDEDNIPVLGEYSRLISENKAAVSLISQMVSDTQASVSLLAQYTGMDNVAVVESSDDKSDWDTSLVYYDSETQTYWYHNGTQWTATNNPVTAGLDTTIAQISAKADDNSSSITSLTQSVNKNTSNITSVTQTANANSASITSLSKTVSSQGTTLASVKTTANNASSSVSAIVSNIGSNGTVTAASIVAKVNAAASSVQIEADHIDLSGKTIALTADNIKITSTNFNVTTAGAMTLEGKNSSIDIIGTGTDSAIITLSYSSGSNTNQLYPIGSLTYNANRQQASYQANGLSLSDGSSGYLAGITLTNGELRVLNTAQPDYAIRVYAPPNVNLVNTVYVQGMFSVVGTKSKVSETESYGDRLLYCVESPSPYFSDYGRGTISDDGKLTIWLDPLFIESIDTDFDYFVQVTPESAGSCYVSERTFDHFTVIGDAGMQFMFTVTAPQIGYSAQRFEVFERHVEDDRVDTDQESVKYDAIADRTLVDYENSLI